MREMQALNKARYVPAEEWAWKRIRKTGGKWERQAIWSCRIFDFFSIKRGIAVEIDGDTHNPTYDAIRDEYNFFRSGIVVLRVRNFNEADLDAAIAAYWTNDPTNAMPFASDALFPAKKKAGLDLKWLRGHKGVGVSLMPSAFDAKATFRTREGFKFDETEMR